MNKIEYEPIGIIHSPFKTVKGTPIQPYKDLNTIGSIEIFPKYQEGLSDLQEFSHIVLIYHFHLVKKSLLKVKPFMDDKLHGIFSTRAPARPNPIGISIVKLLKIEENILHIKNVDIIDNTPLLDIKPFVPDFDIKDVKNIGWLKKNVKKLKHSKDDGRFLQ